MAYDREPRYIHPFIFHQLENILSTITSKLPANHQAKLVSAHRTQVDQFELFKKGRTFINNEWKKTGNVVTNIDGFIKMSRHNYLPCTAIDISLFNGNKYLDDSPLYKHVSEGKKSGLNWGGDWNKFKDLPHLEIPPENFFKGVILKDIGLIWQKYLQKAGAYTGALDGIFGSKSLEALKAVTGEDNRTLKAWDFLFENFGAMEKDYF